MREDEELVDLLYFFKNNQFFKDFRNQNGLQGLCDCISRLNYLEIPKGNFVMRQGDFGDTYYIILKGKTSVLLNNEVTYRISIPPVQDLNRQELNDKAIEFIELFKAIIGRYEFILENEKKQRFLQDMNFYFPGCVKINSQSEYYINSKALYLNII